jgi:PHD/YefM family antitoxin component YafN of YafNO toxin-antitoxin module
MHESIEIEELPSRLDQLALRLSRGARFVVLNRGKPMAALVSLAELNDLDETDNVLADQGLLDALREARTIAGEDPSDYDP